LTTPRESWTPHTYQIRGMSLMLQQAALGLSLDPGMGKTSTWLGAFVALKEAGYVDKMLVICPIKPMYGTWPLQIDKYEDFAHLTWTFLHGPHKEYNLRVEADIYLINPEGVQWLCETIDPSKLADVLCVDESTKFKNWSSKRLKALKPFLPRFQRKWIGTGNISPGGLVDLFAQTYILDCGHALGRGITKFRERWFDADPWNKYAFTPKPEAFQEITEAIAPLYLQLNAEDHLVLPELQVTDVKVSLPPSVMRTYKEVEQEFFAELPDLDMILEAPTNAAAGVKCRQIANGAVYTGDGRGIPDYVELHDEKISALAELLEEIGEHPTIIVYEFRHDKYRIASQLPGIPDITGQSGGSLTHIQDQWNAGKIPRLLMQSSSAHGLNIQESGYHMIWFGLTWNWEDYKQVVDRLRRQGQRATMVMVYRLLAEGTLDIEVANRLYLKQQTEARIKNEIGRLREINFGR